MVFGRYTKLSLIVIILQTFSFALSAPISHKDFAIDYLIKYSYLLKSKSDVKDDDLIDGVKKFQKFIGIYPTGKLNNATLNAMNTPRCSNSDEKKPKPSAEMARMFEGSAWSVKTINYRVLSYPSSMSKHLVDSELKKAFNVWSAVTDLKFVQKEKGLYHIGIKFVRGDHGDKHPFDGMGGTLAHAFYPDKGGDVHFDLDENWTAFTYEGSNFNQIATHELGHSLGLKHSDNTRAIMSPFYMGFSQSFYLQHEEVVAIQLLYGLR